MESSKPQQAAAQSKPVDQIAKPAMMMISKSASTKIMELAPPIKAKPSSLLVNEKPPLVVLDQISNKPVGKRQVWDCGSSLYDSFELNSFNRQLDSAIQASTRTFSMPHLPDRLAHAPASAPPPAAPLPTSTTLTKHQVVPKKFGKVSKSFQKMLKSVFSSSKTANNTTNIFVNAKTDEKKLREGFYVYDGSKSVRVLSTIPETHETDGYNKQFFSPIDSTPKVRRAASERFTAASLGVSCA